MKRPKRTVEANRVTLYDGTQITRIVGKERRSFLLIPYNVVTVCYVPREADVLRVVNAYRDDGVFYPPGFEELDPAHRCMVVERVGGVVAICACDERFYVPFDRADDSGQAIRKALNLHMAHVEAQPDKPRLHVVV